MLMSEFPVVSVHIPPTLRAYTDGHAEVMASGETVGDILEAVGHTYPLLGKRLLSGNAELSAGLCVYLGSHTLRGAGLLSTPVLQEETVSLVATGDSAAADDGMACTVRASGQMSAGDISIGD